VNLLYLYTCLGQNITEYSIKQDSIKNSIKQDSIKNSIKQDNIKNSIKQDSIKNSIKQDGKKHCNVQVVRLRRFIVSFCFVFADKMI